MKARSGILVSALLIGNAQALPFAFNYETGRYLAKQSFGQSDSIYSIDLNGQINSFDSAFSPINRFGGSTFFGDPEFTPFYLGNQAGLITISGKFLTFDANGKVTTSDLVKDGIMQCQRETPQEPCLFLGDLIRFNLNLMVVFTQSAGVQALEFDGSRYGPLSQPLKGLDAQEIASISAGGMLAATKDRSGWLMVGREGSKISLYRDGVWTEGSIPLFENTTHHFVQTATPVGKDWVFSGGASDASGRGRIFVLVARLTPSGIEVEDVTSRVLSLPDQSSILGIDEQGWVYSQTYTSNAIQSSNVNATAITEIPFECRLQAVPVSHVGAEAKGKWMFCPKKFVRLADGNIADEISVEIENMSFGGISDPRPESLQAIAMDYNRRVMRIDSGTQTYLERVNAFPRLDGSANLFEFRGKICRSTGAIRCLDRGEWKTWSPLPFKEIKHSKLATWGLIKRDTQMELWRLDRLESETWQLVNHWSADGERNSGFASSHHSEEVAVVLPSGQLVFHQTASGESREPVDTSEFAEMTRPAIDGLGWVYGICNVSNGEEIVARSLCTVDRHGIFRRGEEIANSFSPMFYPLKNSALMSGLSYRSGDLNSDVLVRGTQSILLGEVFGEFSQETRQAFRLGYTLTVDGDLLIERKIVDAGGAGDKAYHFDGTLLRKVAFTMPDDSDERSISNGSSDDEWPAIHRLWLGRDGLVRAQVPNVDLKLGTNDAEAWFSVRPSIHSTLSGAKIGEHFILGTAQGLWDCDPQASVALTPDTYEIPRNSTCQHIGFSGSPRQILAASNQSVWAVSGTDLYGIDLVSHDVRRELGGILSRRLVALGDGGLSFADADGLVVYDPKTKLMNRRQPLPTGVGPREVIGSNENVLCSIKGIWTRTQAGAWQKQTSSCRGDAWQQQQMWAVDGGKVLNCNADGCVEIRDFGDEIEEDARLEKVGEDLQLSSGMRVWSIDLGSGSARRCEAAYVYDRAPASEVQALVSGAALTSQNGIVTDVCGSEPRLLRIH